MPNTFKPPSEAQNKARARSWRIFRLRGLHAQAHMLTGWCQSIALAAIDAELLKLGAQPETARQQAIRENYQ